MRHAIWVPLFDELAEPREAVRVAVEAEERAWDGFFVWDHIAFAQHEMADAWLTLAAVASATSAIHLGPMVSALPRRRPGKLVRETVTLDRLSGGRFVLGAGLGSDRFGREFSAFGETADDRTRAAMLDETLAVLTAAWTGEPVQDDRPYDVAAELAPGPRPRAVRRRRRHLDPHRHPPRGPHPRRRPRRGPGRSARLTRPA